MLTVVTFKWNDPGYGGKFSAEHVNIMQRMVARHYRSPHRFVCFTDDPAGIDADIEALPLWDDYASLPNPTGGGRPSCYRRLKLFDPAMRDVLGERFVSIDLDTVIVNDLGPVWDRPEDVVMFRAPHGKWPYNGAMFMVNTGARPQVWRDFDPVESPRLAAAKGYQGSDQAWLSYCLGPDEAVWTDADGVYYPLPAALRQQPGNARVVFTTGRRPPWKSPVPWVRAAYR